MAVTGQKYPNNLERMPGIKTRNPAPTPLTGAAQNDLMAILRYFGLESLYDRANAIVEQEGVAILQSRDVFINSFRDTEAFKQRFSGNEERRRRGLSELSPATYIAYEKDVKDTLRANGLPMGFYDTQQDLSNFIGRDIGVPELDFRIKQGYRKVLNAEPGVVAELKTLYGLSDGDVAAFFLDEQRTMDVVAQKASAAVIAYQARQQAEVGLTAQEAETLARAGQEANAASGFGAIRELQDVFRGAPGEDNITREEQIAGVFGTSGAAAQRIRQRQAQRVAGLSGGGGFASQGGTVTGLQ
jgi:hypothetical protein